MPQPWFDYNYMRDAIENCLAEPSQWEMREIIIIRWLLLLQVTKF